MAKLRIQVYKNGAEEPQTSFAIPLSIIKVAAKVIPASVTKAMQVKGIDIKEIAKRLEDPEARGVLADINEKENERVVVSLE